MWGPQPDPPSVLIDAMSKHSCQSCGQNRALSNKPLFNTRQESWRDYQAQSDQREVLASVVRQEVSQTICVLSNMGRSLAVWLLLVTLVVMTGCDVFWPPDGASVAPNIQQSFQETLCLASEVPYLVRSSATALNNFTLSWAQGSVSSISRSVKRYE